MNGWTPPPSLSDPAFWAGCFLDEYAADLPDADEEAEAPAGILAGYDVGGGYALLVDAGTSGADLQLAVSDEKPVQLGWDDLAHWHPHALREPDFPFAALAALVERARSRCAALCEQPWAVTDAVQHAAGEFGGEPTADHRAALATALRAAGCVDPAVLLALAPLAGDLRALVMTELLLGSEPGSLVRAHSPAPPRPLRRYHAYAHLPVDRGADREGLASRLKPHLNAALRAAGLGSTKDGPARLVRLDDTEVDRVPLDLIDDWRAGLDLTRDILRAAGAPAGTTVEITRRGATLTTDLDEPLPGD